MLKDQRPSCVDLKGGNKAALSTRGVVLLLTSKPVLKVSSGEHAAL